MSEPKTRKSRKRSTAEPQSPPEEAAAPPASADAPAESPEIQPVVECPADADAQITGDQVAGEQVTEAPVTDEQPEAAVTDAASTDEATDESGELTCRQIVEAILFAADAPLAPQKIVAVLGTGSAREIRKMVDELNAGYADQQRPYRIEEIAGGLQMLTLPQYNAWLRRLRQSKQESRLSPAAMETLAVIAYKQPVVRAQVEAIRGVSVGEVLHRLRELGLVKIVGRDEDVGRPLLYGTTKRFLEIFGLSSLEDLPAVEELQMPSGA